jgi:hypothetical protein
MSFRSCALEYGNLCRRVRKMTMTPGGDVGRAAFRLSLRYVFRYRYVFRSTTKDDMMTL